MRKGFFIFFIALITLALATSITISAYAEDLPIDINAIGRQDARSQTTRIGAHLFTQDAQRVNEAFAEQIRRRQSAVYTLFTDVPQNYEIEPHAQILTAADNMALFAQPLSFSNINPQQTTDALPMWVFIPIMAICALGGFIWALMSIAKKKGQQDGVH